MIEILSAFISQTLFLLLIIFLKNVNLNLAVHNYAKALLICKNAAIFKGM